MRPALRLAALVACALAAAACEPTVIIERDEIVSISPGARWAWSVPDGDGPSAARGELEPSRQVHDLLTGAITDGLEARGFPLTTADSAEFFVHFHIARREHVDTLPPANTPRTVDDRDRNEPWGHYGNPERFPDRTMVWQEGLLVVDALSADGRHVSWRGIIHGEVKPEAAQEPSRAIRSAVDRLLAQFP